MAQHHLVITLDKHDLLEYANKLDIVHISQGDMKRMALTLRNAIIQSGVIERTLRLCLQDIGIEVK